MTKGELRQMKCEIVGKVGKDGEIVPLDVPLANTKTKLAVGLAMAAAHSLPGMAKATQTSVLVACYGLPVDLEKEHRRLRGEP